VERKYYPSINPSKFLFTKRGFVFFVSAPLTKDLAPLPPFVMCYPKSLGLLPSSPFWSSHPGKPRSKSFYLFNTS